MPSPAAVTHWKGKDMGAWFKENGFVRFTDTQTTSLPEHRRCMKTDESVQSGEKCELHMAGKRSSKLEPEYMKFLVSAILPPSVTLLMAFCTVIAHERVPDMSQHPPLPDIVLDHLPYVPWALAASELFVITLLAIWALTLLVHKHRFILMRRMFCIMATIHVLRSVSIVITSPTAPNIHRHCHPALQDNAGLWEMVKRAVNLWSGGGMSVLGVDNCGDYMFSGHTVFATILNFFITEYTPRRLYWMHVTTWTLNIFVMFFILVSHEHYSMDVWIAFIIASCIFQYYHSLVDIRVLTQGDRERTYIWFPLFSYFEANVRVIVPNDFEWPFCTPHTLNVWFKRNKAM